MARTEKTNFFHKYYDKLLVVVVLIALLLSLFALFGFSKSQSRKEDAFTTRIDSLKPKFPKAEEIDLAVFESAMASVKTPYKLSDCGLLVACERVACVACNWPIKMGDTVCTYCSAKQPEEVDKTGWDSDGDGMDDEWEVKYGLNPVDPSDAAGDLDGDAFTNLEEYQAKTDPTDPKSFPPRIDFMRVDKIDAVQFPYVLKSKQTLAGGQYSFQINEGSRTYFARIGQEINKSGWVLESYTNKMVVVRTPGIPDRNEIVAVLRLVKDGEKVEIVERGGPVWNTSEVTLICEKDPERTPIMVKDRESFAFDDDTYTVVRIVKDKGSSTGSVIIRQESTGRDIRVPPR
jgi:hypothetical protein